MNLFNLFAKITLDNSEYEKKLNQSQKSTSSFASKVGSALKTGVKAFAGFAAGVTVAAGAVAGFAMKVIQSGSDIDDNAQKLGVSTEGYQYWSLVLQRAGTDASQLSMAIRNMTTMTQNLSAGNADALLTLEKLGIGYEDFMGMNTEQQLYSVVEALQGLESETDKVAIAQDVFGSRVYQELLPLLNMEQGSLGDLQTEFEDLGLILSDTTVKGIAEVGDKIDNFTNTIKTAALSIGADFLPEIELITDGLMGLVSGSDDAVQALSDGLMGLINKIAQALPTIIQTAGDLLIQIIVGLGDTLSDPGLINSLVSVVETLLFKVVEILPKLTSSFYKIATALFKALLDLDWGSLIINLLEALLQIVFVEFPKMMTDITLAIIDKFIALFTTADGLKSLANFGLSLAEALVNGLISGVESGLNAMIRLINSLLGGLSNLWSWLGIPAIPEIPQVSFGRVDFAEGGMFPDGKGTLYALAGEEGAEIVARGSRGTGVANIEQIADAQYMAMQDYDIRGAIQQAAAAIVNGVVGGLGDTTQGGGNTPVIIRIGDKDFNGYIVNTVNGTLKAQGRKSLNRITAYGRG